MFLDIFSIKKPIMAMLHLKGDNAAERLERAKRETDIYTQNGVDAVIVEDYFGDVDDVERALEYLSAERPDVVCGVNVLDKFEQTYELARRYGAQFMQVDSVAGHLPAGEPDESYAAMIERYRADGKVQVIGGVRFKYQPYLSGRSLQEDLTLGAARCDAICVTGEGTGLDTGAEKIAEFRAILGPAFPLIVGAGLTPQNLFDKLSIADGAIVGSYFKQNGVDKGDVDAARVREFMQSVRQLREAR